MTAVVLDPYDPNGPVWERERQFGEFDRRVAAATGQRNAADAAVVALVRECLDEDWWRTQGTSSPEHWCRARLGVSVAASQRLVRIARVLPLYPCVAGAFAEGRISMDQVDVVAQMRPNRRYDKALAESGPLWDLPRMRKIIRNFSLPPEPVSAAGDDDTGDEQPTPQPAEDWVRIVDGDDGRCRGSFDVNPLLGALIKKALGASRDALFKERTGVDPEDDDRTKEANEVTMLDAFERLAHAALDGLDPEVVAGRRPGDRYQVLVHVNADEPEDAHLHLGPSLPPALRRQVCCDADVREAIVRDGRIVALGRRRRTVDTALRWAIEERDGGCRVNGCGRSRFLHIHHIRFWEDGGPTDPSNLVALCPEHHRAVHAGELDITGDPESVDDLVFTHRGTPLPTPRAHPPSGPPPDAVPFGGTHWAQRWRPNSTWN